MCTNALPSVLVHMRTISLRTPGGAVRTRWVVENQDGRGDFMFILYCIVLLWAVYALLKTLE